MRSFFVFYLVKLQSPCENCLDKGPLPEENKKENEKGKDFCIS